MEATEKEPHLLRARLEDKLRRLGHRVGTDTVPLATGCFLWLEAHHRPADILSLGTASPALLEEFLKVKQIKNLCKCEIAGGMRCQKQLHFPRSIFQVLIVCFAFILF